ncbi:MAG TPA: DUF2844 domain-containing protein [Candidatus Acidoferrales bacterium]|nr:DUF2844 domain-containing protein [Candidatus Acidoferrales bacterium]
MKIRWGIVLALIFGAVPLWAALGAPEQSIEADRERMAGQVKRTAMQGYTLHEISAPGGRVVREYVSPSGVVFGVAWEGPAMPDLSSLLGSYFSQFQEASASPHRRHGPLYVQTGQLVVVSGGHQRAFRGLAYVSGLIPEGLSKDVIR